MKDQNIHSVCATYAEHGGKSTREGEILFPRPALRLHIPGTGNTSIYLASALLTLVITEASTFLGLATDQQGFSCTYSFCQENVCETVLLP
jgi:hypothetical protein